MRRSLPLLFLILTTGLAGVASPARADVTPPVPSGGQAAPLSAPAPGASAAPAGASLPPELREALERLNRQEAELKALRQEMAAERAARAEKDAADAAERQKLRAALDAQEKKSAERATGLLAGVAAARSARLQLTLSGFVQADYSLRQSSEDQVDPATREPLNEDRFGIRRARLTVGADYGIVGGNVTIDGNTLRGAAIRVLGAEATLRWPAPKAGAPPGTLPLIAATFGSFKNPFGYEVSLQSDTQRLFVERSAVARALFPGEYDLGFRLQGGWRFLRYAFAIMNGEPIGERSFPVRDPNKAKDYLGRLGIDTELLPWLRIAAGVSALRGTGFDRGSPATKDTLVWRDLNENGSVDPGEVQVIAGTSAVPASNFSRFGFGGDFQLGIRVPRLGRLVLYGELAYAANLDRGIQPANPVTAARTLRELGWYLAATQELGRWAQIGIRYDRYNPDLDANDRQAGVLVPNDASVSTLSLVGAARFRDVARFIVEYDVNRNHLGRDASGRPTNLRDNALTLRAEVVF